MTSRVHSASIALTFLGPHYPTPTTTGFAPSCSAAPTHRLLSHKNSNSPARSQGRNRRVHCPKPSSPLMRSQPLWTLLSTTGVKEGLHSFYSTSRCHNFSPKSTQSKEANQSQTIFTSTPKGLISTAYKAPTGGSESSEASPRPLIRLR